MLSLVKKHHFCLFLIMLACSHSTIGVSKPSCGGCGEVATKKKKGKNLPCHPPGYVDPKVASSFNAALRELKRAGIKPKITSTWRSSQEQDKLHRCSLDGRCRKRHPELYYALPPGQSAHEAGFAIDISGIAVGPRGRKRLTPEGRRVVQIMSKHGFKWRYKLADPAHFEAEPRKYGYRSLEQAIRYNQTHCSTNIIKRTATARVPNKPEPRKSTASKARRPLKA
jgi:hypothetical protein